MKEIIQHAEEISMLKYGIIGGNENALEFIDAAKRVPPDGIYAGMGGNVV